MDPVYEAKVKTAVKTANDSFEAIKSSLLTVEDLRTAIAKIIGSDLNIELPSSYQIYMTYSGLTGAVNGGAIATAATLAAPDTVANVDLTAAGVFLKEHETDLYDEYERIVADGYLNGQIPTDVMDKLRTSFNNSVLYGGTAAEKAESSWATASKVYAEHAVTARLLPRRFCFDASDEQLVVNKAVEEVVPFLG
ncbi:hypothetical protein HF264_36280 [Rhizobium leguminosarum]|uniref:hypothetical protein n=1 Tax=Rhizobium leguminosarum TaxID=384 RepID=UPI001C90C1ED|nr:hypothetical protein [Rhizobium leguminosarum]MBY2945058.1 hypothetical protein [Rhizobium leguminosarum]